MNTTKLGSEQKIRGSTALECPRGNGPLFSFVDLANFLACTLGKQCSILQDFTSTFPDIFLVWD